MYYRYLELASYVKGGSVTPHWMSDGSSFWYAEGAPENSTIWKVDPKANTKTPLFDTARLRRALRLLLGHDPAYGGLPFSEFVFADAEKAVRFTVEGQEFILRLETYEITPAPRLSERENRQMPKSIRGVEGISDVTEVLSPDGLWAATLKNHNLWLRSTTDGSEVQLTHDGVERHDWSRRYWAEWVWWSPASSKLAAMKVDSGEVPEAHRVDLKPGDTEYETRTELFIIDIRSRQRLRVETGRKPGERIQILGWRWDGSELLYLVMNRSFKRLDLRAANVASGATRVILSEQQETFVMGVWWERRQVFTLLEDGERFIWGSERDGWNHLYLYRLDGTLVKRLTSGNYPVVQVDAVDEQEGWVYFTASDDRRRPYDLHLYRVTLEAQNLKRLTEQPGQHTIAFSPSKKYYLDTHSAPDRPPVVELRRADGRLMRVLSRANVDALRDLQWQPPEQFVVKAVDGRTGLYGLLYKPYDFDPRKSYPVIECIYGGPHLSLLGTWGRLGSFLGWDGAVLCQALAQLGFIVFIVDGRGTPDRGKAFQDFGHGAMGLHEIPEHVAVLKGLARERPYMDLERVGVVGRSFGGYMVLRAMLTAPNVYHVGAANDPFVELDDIRIHRPEVRAYIPYLGWLEENEEAYALVSVLPLAANLKGKLLLSHGEGAYARQAMKIVSALADAGKALDVLPPLPGQDHFLTGVYGTRWQEAVRTYFQKHLKP